MEGNPYIMTLIPQLGIAFTAICTLIGIIVQVKNSNKTKSNNDIIQSVDMKLDKLQEESTKADKELKKCMDDHHLHYYKDQLVSIMSRIQNGYKLTAEEKQIIYEQKSIYNSLGGDSYVDDMFDRLVEEHLI